MGFVNWVRYENSFRRIFEYPILSINYAYCRLFIQWPWQPLAFSSHDMNILDYCKNVKMILLKCFSPCCESKILLFPDLCREGHYRMLVGVCLSVSRVPRPNSRTERHGSSKLAGWKPITRVTGNPWICLEVKRLKVKVTGPINAISLFHNYMHILKNI